MGIRGDHNCKQSASALHLEDEFLVSLKQTKPQRPDIMHVQELVHPTHGATTVVNIYTTPSLLLMNLLINDIMPGQKENPRQAPLVIQSSSPWGI
ncbi:hypothetical protein I305_04334 [Cryptococcus gattii E566]|uniref:Uncharacterized protein n=2 Tax=Cryptococcus gattii TaxID=37769 RepID=E6R678_CRYGW|nr:Hypothetical Protein CGB_E6510W [Cryptococcus gattii WM276]ADV22696.1 Hypothetical Protein CGB_E6510W [Cryptococcus gattii WM276]KIR78301.1 hypothetical protein I306_04743 [Cryptococcus gattii EJB2]KIY33007.1 hypothetical protein I305_04334 [Cryptococcus gattii E566]KJD99608.1 hypothetical protein I311_06799 [Cryptococcus gattii NT-10]